MTYYEYIIILWMNTFCNGNLKWYLHNIKDKISLYLSIVNWLHVGIRQEDLFKFHSTFDYKTVIKPLTIYRRFDKRYFRYDDIIKLYTYIIII